MQLNVCDSSDRHWRHDLQDDFVFHYISHLSFNGFPVAVYHLWLDVYTCKNDIFQYDRQFGSAPGEIDFDGLSHIDHFVGYLFGIVVALILVILLLPVIMNEAYDEVKNTAEP